MFSDIRVINTGSGSFQKMKGEAQKPTGLVVSATELIRSFLSTASEDPHLSPELQQIASDLLSQHNVPYKSLRAIWFASQPTTRPTLIQLFSGSDFIFATPKARHKVTHFLISSFLSRVWLMGKFRKENVYITAHKVLVLLKLKNLSSIWSDIAVYCIDFVHSLAELFYFYFFLYFHYNFEI